MTGYRAFAACYLDSGRHLVFVPLCFACSRTSVPTVGSVGLKPYVGRKQLSLWRGIF